MRYHVTIMELFSLLWDANLADTKERAEWQVANDCEQNTQWGLGYYGAIRHAIVLIAGEAIVENWAETGEVDLSLANRNPSGEPNRYEDLDRVPFGC